MRMESFRKLRRFAQAARDADFSKKERRDIAINPKRAIVNGDPESSRPVTSHSLRELFASLEGEKFDAGELRRVGNYFRDYRADAPEPMPELDMQAFNMGCKLLEDSFYRGDLFDHPKEEAASLTYLVNNAAKVAEDPRNFGRIKAFDPHRCEEFIGAVRTFHKEKTAEEDAATFDLSTREQSAKLSKLARQKENFAYSTDFVLKNIAEAGPAGVAYLIKTCLIMNDMAAGYKEDMSVTRKREDLYLRGMYFAQDIRYVPGSNQPAYQFFRGAERPFAVQHFHKAETALAIWCNRYLRSRKAQRVVEEEDGEE